MVRIDRIFASAECRMKSVLFCISLLAATIIMAGEPETVRVAAVQCPSVMGQTDANLNRITNLVRQAVIPNGFDIVAANWSAPSPEEVWPGRGHSCIITSTGEVLKMAESVVGAEIVIADLPIRKQGRN
jgi:predicted amidohydrolase